MDQSNTTGLRRVRIQDRGDMKLLPDHSALSANRTIHTKMVRSVRPGEKPLKLGSSNSKIGGPRVKIGRWKGFRMLSCTNEERATCPLTCQHRADCYGNNMPFAIRYRIDRHWYDAVSAQLMYECGRGPVALRLKVLGDFSGPEEMKFWYIQMCRNRNLYVWGFTAHRSGIMRAMLLGMELEFPGRWVVRTSGAGDVPWAANAEGGPGFVCPGISKGLTCVTCGLCWSTSKPVVFPDH